MSRYGRFQVPETPPALARLHVRDFTSPLREVSHPPRVGVLDQQDLLSQGIRCSTFIPGATDVDALGSCTANATMAKLSSFLPEPHFEAVVARLACEPVADPYTNLAGVERAAIGFYHACSDQTGQPDAEWPPTDCGSSGPYIVELLEQMGLCSGAQIASGPDNIVSLLQQGSLLIGSPFLSVWEEPAAGGMVDGDGSASTLQSQLAYGVAGGHETLVYAIEKLSLLATGHVDAASTILRVRNSWSRSWGDGGDYLIHLSTIVAFGGQVDLRLLEA